MYITTQWLSASHHGAPWPVYILKLINCHMMLYIKECMPHKRFTLDGNYIHLHNDCARVHVQVISIPYMYRLCIWLQHLLNDYIHSQLRTVEDMGDRHVYSLCTYICDNTLLVVAQASGSHLQLCLYAWECCDTHSHIHPVHGEKWD